MKLPNDKAGLFLTHNEHKHYYDTAGQWLEQNSTKFKNPEDRQRAIDNDEIWTLQWYPDTPVGFIRISAPTLDELLEFANQIENRQTT